MAPEAHIVHRTPERLRIRIDEKKGDLSYFSTLKDKFSRYRSFENITENHLTGSLLFVEKRIDADAIFEFAESNHLFDLRNTLEETQPLSQRVVQPIRKFDSRLNRFTKGEIDLSGFIFMILLVSGIFQIARGNFAAPPWYTAFWYALGIFTKSISDMRKEKVKKE
jgi:hypothetical protein